MEQLGNLFPSEISEVIKKGINQPKVPETIGSGTRQVSSVNTVSTEQVVKPVETKVRAEPIEPVISQLCPKYGHPYKSLIGPHVYIRGRCTYCEIEL